MKSPFISKTLIAALSVSTLFSATANAADKSFARAQKELKIMSRIFDTSLNEANEGKRRFLSSQNSSATYLAKQGMVFSFNFGRNTFDTASDWAAFGEGVGHLVGEIASEVGNAFAEVEIPEAPEAIVNLEEYYEDYQERIEAQEYMRERLAEQREQVREVQREIRRVEREQRHAQEQEVKQAEKLRKKLQEKLSVLEKKKDEYSKTMKEYREKRDQKYLASSKKKSDAIISTLCDYGATLKSLKNDEFVTIIFENYNDQQDQVYVFEYSDVKSCDSGKDLLKEAISYKI